MLCATKSACYKGPQKTPEIAPPGIFLRHPHHKPLSFLVNSGTTPEFARYSFLSKSSWSAVSVM
jgi:hypothetical protein